MNHTLFIMAMMFTIVSCDYFSVEDERVAVARVNDSYLYEEDIRALVSEGTSKEDSTLLINNFITRWATKQLLIDQAEINLSEDKLQTFDKLVNEYKNDLYTEAYKNVIVTRQLDSTVSQQELEDYYDLYKENFKLNNELLKLRYIQIDPDYSKMAETREMLNRFNEKDQQELQQMSIQFKSFNFNDSVWVKKDAVLEEISVLSTENDDVLKKSNFTQLQDSLGVYLMKIEDVLESNDIAPLSYVKPTIKEIILNKRKLELIKKLEKDITKDAIKNNKFEIYTPR